MKKIFVLALIVVGFSTAPLTQAIVQPVPGVLILAKEKLCTGCPPTSKTFATTVAGTDGIFKLESLDVDASYEIYYNDEALAPLGIYKAKNGIIAGRLSIEFFDSHTKAKPQPTTAPAAKTPPTTQATPTINHDTFISGNWDDAHLNKLKQLLIKEGTLPATTATGKTKVTDLRDAIAGFQKKHGLKLTGELGPATVSALNKAVLK
jgi:hypothetical protein